MYYQLSGAVTNRIIKELRNYWSYHPKFRDRLVNAIQGRYSFQERPQVGMIVKSAGANILRLSPDNFVGTVHSYAALAKYRNHPGVAIEWIREDAVAIQNNGGVFPSPPGIYYVDMDTETQFYVDVLHDITNEQVQNVSGTIYALDRPYLEGTLVVYEQPSGWQLREGVNYTANAETGEITLTDPLPDGRWLVADYRSPNTSRGPFEIRPNRAHHTAIPGVVLAFGNRIEAGDRMAVVVRPTRCPAYLEFGGHWDVNVDIDIFARDVYEQREIADRSVIFLFGVLRSYLANEGLEMKDISLGGEAEEAYDEAGDDYYYTSSISLTIRTDWAIQVPLEGYIRQAAPLTSEDADRISALDEDNLDGETGNIQALEPGLNLEAMTDPFFKGKNSTYEDIK